MGLCGIDGGGYPQADLVILTSLLKSAKLPAHVSVPGNKNLFLEHLLILNKNYDFVYIIDKSTIKTETFFSCDCRFTDKILGSTKPYHVSGFPSH